MMRDDLVGLPLSTPPDPDDRPHRLFIYESLNKMDGLLDKIVSEFWEYEEMFDEELTIINAIQENLDKLREAVEGGDKEYYR